MTTKKYLAVLTPAGEMKLAVAALNNEPVGFSMMAVGDGAACCLTLWEGSRWLMSDFAPRSTGWLLQTGRQMLSGLK